MLREDQPAGSRLWVGAYLLYLSWVQPLPGLERQPELLSAILVL